MIARASVFLYAAQFLLGICFWWFLFDSSSSRPASGCNFDCSTNKNQVCDVGLLLNFVFYCYPCYCIDESTTLVIGDYCCVLPTESYYVCALGSCYAEEISSVGINTPLWPISVISFVLNKFHFSILFVLFICYRLLQRLNKISVPSVVLFSFISFIFGGMLFKSYESK